MKLATSLVDTVRITSLPLTLANASELAARPPLPVTLTKAVFGTPVMAPGV